MDAPYYRNSGPSRPGPGPGRGRTNPSHQQQQQHWGGRGGPGGMDDYEGPVRHNRPRSRNQYIHQPGQAPYTQSQSQYHGHGHGGRRDMDGNSSSGLLGQGPSPRPRTEYATTSNSAGNIQPPPGMYPQLDAGRSAEFRSSAIAPLLIDPTGLGSPRPNPSPGGSSGYGHTSGLVKPNVLGNLAPPLGTGAPEKIPNDCEIIVLGKGQQQYAERIEASIRESGLQVDLMFPKADVKLSAFIENIASTGSAFAVVIRPDNESHRSVSVHVLKGPPKPEEHRNMPLATAYGLIRDRFKELKRKELSNIPDSVKKGIHLILDDRFLTDHEYQEVIHYVQARWHKQRAYERRTDFDSGTGISTETELKERILKIMGFASASDKTDSKQKQQPQPRSNPLVQDNAPVTNYFHAPQPPRVGGYY